MPEYADRICPVCGLTFTPKTKRQIYHSDYCRVKASRERKKNVDVPVEINWMLEQIRRIDPESALDLEQVAKEVGLKYAEKMILIGYRLANRGAIVQAKNVLIEAGEVKPRRKAVKPPKNPT